MTPFAAWQNFYVIIGSSAGALTGLQFVVMAFIADLPITRDGVQSTDAFGTPTIVHFGAVLLLSGLVSVPWGGVGAPALLFGLCGVMGFGYVIIVSRRARKQTEYTPVSTLTKPFSALQRPRCCCSLSAFTTPGTLSRIWSSYVGRSSTKIPSGATDKALPPPFP